ncbi:hypothetical protein NQD34_018323 [Periophthalmus magnuspinnatus]|nr:hypothetical protein NQD34_018323 [Periophthalmus magnuspinnatus]
MIVDFRKVTSSLWTLSASWAPASLRTSSGSQPSAPSSQAAGPDDGAVLHGHRVHPHLLYHCVVRWGHCQGQTETAAHCASAEKVIGCSLPCLQDLYISRTQGRAGHIAADTSHPGHGLFEPLPSGRRLRSYSFFPSAVCLMNTL